MVGASLITCLFTELLRFMICLELPDTCEIREAAVLLFLEEEPEEKEAKYEAQHAMICILDSGHPNQRGDAKSLGDAFFWGQEFPPEKEESSVEAPVVQETPEAPFWQEECCWNIPEYEVLQEVHKKQR